MIVTKQGTYETYKEYLQSEHWKDIKKRFYKSKLNKHKCYVCGNRYDLHLHHKSYKRLGEERLWDLVQLCGRCHKQAHALLNQAREKGNETVNLWNVARKLKRKKRGVKQNKSSKPKRKKKKLKGQGIFRVFR